MELTKPMQEIVNRFFVDGAVQLPLPGLGSVIDEPDATPLRYCATCGETEAGDPTYKNSCCTSDNMLDA